MLIFNMKENAEGRNPTSIHIFICLLQSFLLQLIVNPEYETRKKIVSSYENKGKNLFNFELFVQGWV
jgi:hypothetical protein